jgi:hypothetical protein
MGRILSQVEHRLEVHARLQSRSGTSRLELRAARHGQRELAPHVLQLGEEAHGLEVLGAHVEHLRHLQLREAQVPQLDQNLGVAEPLLELEGRRGAVGWFRDCGSPRIECTPRRGAIGVAVVGDGVLDGGLQIAPAPADPQKMNSRRTLRALLALALLAGCDFDRARADLEAMANFIAQTERRKADAQDIREDPIIEAAFHANTEAVRRMLAQSPDSVLRHVQARDVAGMTALHRAAWAGSAEIAHDARGRGGHGGRA